MAKQHPPQDVADVVIFFARARGGSAVVAQSVQALAAAVQQAALPQIAPKVIKSLSSKSASQDKPAESTLFDGVSETDEQELSVGDVADPADSGMPGDAGGEKKAPKARKNPTYSFVKDLNLRPQGKKSLKDFITEKAPQDQQARLAAIIYYLTKDLGLPNVGVNHVYTALKEIGERVPSDIAQIARNIAGRKGWLDSADSDDLKVTTRGENFVEHELPSAGAQESP